MPPAPLSLADGPTFQQTAIFQPPNDKANVRARHPQAIGYDLVAWHFAAPIDLRLDEIEHLLATVSERARLCPIMHP